MQARTTTEGMETKNFKVPELPRSSVQSIIKKWYEYEQAFLTNWETVPVQGRD